MQIGEFKPVLQGCIPVENQTRVSLTMEGYTFTGSAKYEGKYEPFTSLVVPIRPLAKKD